MISVGLFELILVYGRTFARTPKDAEAIERLKSSRCCTLHAKQARVAQKLRKMWLGKLCCDELTSCLLWKHRCRVAAMALAVKLGCSCRENKKCTETRTSQCCSSAYIAQACLKNVCKQRVRARPNSMSLLRCKTKISC